MKRTLFSIFGVLILLTMMLGSVAPVAAAPLPGGVDLDQAFIYYMAPSWYDKTDAFNDSSMGTDDYVGFAYTSSDESVYIGMASQFTGVIVDLGATGSNGYVTWEYLHGTTWSSLEGETGFNDGTDDFKNSGTNTVTFATTMPGDWTTGTVNGVSGLYWVRARTTTAYSGPYPQARQVSAITGGGGTTTCITRVPTSDGDVSGNWGSSPRYDDVDETTPNDSDYITGTSGGYCMFYTNSFNVPAGSTVNSLTLYFRAQDAGGQDSNTGARIQDAGGQDSNTGARIMVGGNLRSGNEENPSSSSWNTYDYTWTTNPNTGSAWTVDQINGIGSNALQQIGVFSDGKPNVRISMLYAEVCYTGPAGPVNPSVTINQASGQADPTSSSPIYFDVVFSEAVTGFTNGDVVLSGTAGATSAAVSGSGTTYSVAVSGMSAGGTVIATIPAGVAIGSTSGLTNNASSSADNTVTYEYTVPNPPLGDTCGLDIVLVMDESASIDSGEFAQMQAAFVDFVNSLLPSTPTQFALVDFGTDAVVRQSWTSDATTVINAINGAKMSGTQYTNWEQGLIYAHGLFSSDRAANPDLIIFSSDGNPTAYYYPAQTDMTGVLALPPAIAAADAVKLDGIRIITIGIGDDLDPNNLVDISSSDAYYTSDFDQLADDLAAIASKLCGGTVTVHKVIDLDGDINTTGDQTTIGTAVEDWRFDVTVDSGSVNPTYDLTDDTGTTVAFDISGGTVNVTVTETVKSGYDLFAVEVTGASSSGTYNDAANRIEDITVDTDDIVSVTFYNTPGCGPCETYNPTTGLCDDDPTKDPTADFSANPTSGCAPLTVTFTDLSSSPDGTITAWAWDFDNDGNVDSTSETPSPYTYTDPGSYTVKLTVTNACGTATETKTGYIEVYAHPTAGITPDPAEVCVDIPLQLNGNPTGGSGSYSTHLWTGDTSYLSATDVENPTFTCSTAGTYNLTYTVTDSHGCTGSDDITITVYGNPDCTITAPNNICEGSTGHSASVADAGTSATYAWTISNGTIDSGQGTTSIFFSAGSAGTTAIGVTVTNVNQCNCTSSTDITVYDNPDCTVDIASKSVCENSTGLTASVADAGTSATYAWTLTGDGTITAGADTNSITFDVGVAGGVLIGVTVTNANGCTCTNQIAITVNDSPVADAGPDQVITLGGSVVIGGAPTASGGTPPYTYSWSPATGLSATDVANPTASPTVTTTYVVTVVDANGCVGTDNVDILVRTPNPPGGGGGPDVDRCYLIIDMLGERTMVEIDCCENCTLEQTMAYDANLLHLLELQDDTTILCGDCEGCDCYPRIIVMSLSEENIDPPDGMTIVGPIYDFTGYKDRMQQLECQLVTYFNPTASVQLHYDPSLLPLGATNPAVAFYSHTDGHWVILPSDPGVVAEVGVATGVAEYFASPFTVLASIPEAPATPETPPAPPAPANFVATSLNISPAEAKTGETVTISLNVTNDGEETGTYTAELKINGKVVDSKVVTLSGGQSQPVSFAVSSETAGTYEATVSGLTGVFTVNSGSLWWLYVIIAIVVIGLGFLALRFRKSASS